jgi:hypothetical protein
LPDTSFQQDLTEVGVALKFLCHGAISALAHQHRLVADFALPVAAVHLTLIK